MNIGQFDLPVLIVAIVFGTRMVKQFIASSERRFEMQLSAQRANNESDRAGMKALQDEFARFRETVMQYDLSVEDKLKRIEDRMAFLEQRTQAPRPVASAAAEPQQQVVGTRE